MEVTIDSMLSKMGFEQLLIDEIMAVGRLKKSLSGSIVISGEEPTTEVPIVMNGLLKVIQKNENGDEMFLYYLEGGETCAMSITCCMEGIKKPIKVIAEEDSILWMIPMMYLDKWIIKHESFRRFVFGSYQLRFDELLATIDSVVFSKLDERLYNYLLDTKQATGTYKIHKTHEQIAREMGTSRVVVSRLLKQLEKEEKIEQHRNRIEIL